MTLLTDKQREEVAYIIARAYDKEDAAQRGESDPWAFSYAPALEAEWQAERLACAQSALTAALPAIERAVREDMRLRLARANESLGSVHCAAMNGDNLAVSLCSYFDEGDEWPEGDGDDECGWSPSAVDGYTQTIDAIRQHYTRALAGEVG